MGIDWPRLGETGLDAEAIVRRRSGIGGSDANVILAGDPGALLHLWRVKRGEVEPERLDDILPVMLGQWTEDFSRQWFERQTGLRVGDAGASFRHPDHDWMACSVDGLIRHPGGRLTVFEAKHCSARANAPELIARYSPQLTHNMLVTGADDAALSVIYGNARWEAYSIELDLFYAAELIEAEQEFWDCVQTGRRPIARRIPAPPQRLRLSLWSDRDTIRPANAR
jgi:predicted phage-related endonuclease